MKSNKVTDEKVVINKKDIRRFVGDALSDARNSKKFTQEEFASLLLNKYNISLSLEAFKSYEQGRRVCPVDTFLILATILDLDVNNLKHKVKKDVLKGYSE